MKFTLTDKRILAEGLINRVYQVLRLLVTR